MDFKVSKAEDQSYKRTVKLDSHTNTQRLLDKCFLVKRIRNSAMKRMTVTDYDGKNGRQ